MRLLLPSDPLTPAAPDSFFASELEAITALGIRTGLLDLDALLAGASARSVRRLGEGSEPVLYRGWMIPTAKYAALADAVVEFGCSLVITPESYTATHHLPRTYAILDGLTPRTTWIETSERIDFAHVHEALEPFGDASVVVKDYVKSRKHEWLEAFLIPDASDKATP